MKELFDGNEFQPSPSDSAVLSSGAPLDLSIVRSEAARAPAGLGVLQEPLVVASDSRGMAGQKEVPTESASETAVQDQPTPESAGSTEAPSEFPPGYSYNDELLEDRNEQIAIAHRKYAHQQRPLPSFEGVPQADITPTFNPTNAPASGVYINAERPQGMLSYMRPHSEFHPDQEAIDAWRLEERDRVTSGLGLVASHVLIDNSVGDIGGFVSSDHLGSAHEDRVANPDRATPFLSFTTDPENFAERFVLGKGFGIKGGRDSVVVHTRVHPGRMLTQGKRREDEVLLAGGVAPDEYQGAYEVDDFIRNTVPEDAAIDVAGVKMARDQALEHWRQSGPKER